MKYLGQLYAYAETSLEKEGLQACGSKHSVCGIGGNPSSALAELSSYLAASLGTFQVSATSFTERRNFSPGARTKIFCARWPPAGGSIVAARMQTRDVQVTTTSKVGVGQL